MALPDPRQLAQVGATDGEVLAWNNTSGEWEPQTNSPSMVSGQVAATDSTQTTSTTDVLINSMTVTPGAGNYLIFFSTDGALDTTAVSCWFSVYVNGVKQANSQREMKSGASQTIGLKEILAISGYRVTVGAGQAIEIRWRVTAGATVTAQARSMAYLKV